MRTFIKSIFNKPAPIVFGQGKNNADALHFALQSRQQGIKARLKNYRLSKERMLMEGIAANDELN